MDEPRLKFFGRRKGRPLRARRARLLEELLPKLEARISSPLLFDASPTAVWLEIGFGGGEHLAEQAARHPDFGFIGCEPFINGVASLLSHIEERNLANVRILPDDARPLLEALPDVCLDRCYVLFADPWPKKRHQERRFIGPETLPRLARVLKPGGELRLATDVPLLAAWMRERTNEHPAFECLYDKTEPPADWVQTRYEQKAKAAGRGADYMIYKRRESQTQA